MTPPADVAIVPLSAFGWDSEWDAIATYRDDGVTPARVIRVDRGVCTAFGTAGTVRASVSGSVLDAMSRSSLEAPCAGDWVMLRRWPDARITLEAVLPRRAVLMRAEAGLRSQGQVLAANVSAVGVVVALDRMPALTKVERLLALAWDSGATPVVLLTKADMAGDSADVAADVRTNATDVDVICVSTVTGTGLPQIRALLAPGGTLALVGSSGAGKSTLVNALVGAPVLRTRSIREDGRGRHTSVRREVVLLPSGGCVIDTPGLRGAGLFDVAHGLAATFADVTALAQGCRFGDCRHEREPGCSVHAAIQRGELPPRRLESWRKLRREQAWITARAGARLAADQTRQARLRRHGGQPPRRG